MSLLLVFTTAATVNAVVELPLASALEVQPAERPPYDTGTITLKFRDGVDRARAADVVAELGCTIHRPSLYTPGLNEIAIPAGSDIIDWIDHFRKRLDVEYAHPTYLDHVAFTPNDPQYGNQWHFPMIGMPNAWDKVPSRGSTSVVVCVLDSGVAYENYGTEYVIAKDLSGVTFVSPRDIVNDDYHANDDRNHGTHVCGTIAQRTNNLEGVAGMADGVSIMPVKTLDADGYGSHQDFSDGVHWAVDHGADLINYSAGGSDSPEKHDAVIYAHTNGVLMIAASGNMTPTGLDRLDYPAAYDEAMSVAAVDPGKNLAYYSNYGTGLDVSAPGGETSPTLSNGVLQNTFTLNQPKNMGYHYFQGTSMATPHVTGLAALLMTEGTYTTLSQVKSRIENTCEDLGTAGYDTTFGHGLIDADAAIPSPTSPPVLDWAGILNYTADGLNPEDGYPKGHPSETRFYFRVKYSDADGDAPTRAQCVIQRRLCDGTWRRLKVLAMTPAKAGSYVGGKIYRTSTKLPNEVLRYRFSFQAPDGIATGRPASYSAGPFMIAPPKLCWAGLSGFTSDGVAPDSGPEGTRFTFKVKYMDSWGTPPSTANLEIRRYRRIIKTIPMIRGPGNDRLGVIYRAKYKVRRPGEYSYRFRFEDDIGVASGRPADWTDGPTITGTASASE